MKKYVSLVVCIIFILCMCIYGSSRETEAAIAVETATIECYPAAIMVDGEIYLMEGTPMPAEIDNSAIMGYTESYTDTFPEKNGEINFSRELGQPYAKVENGVAVLYNNEWYLCTPKK